MNNNMEKDLERQLNEIKQSYYKFDQKLFEECDADFLLSKDAPFKISAKRIEFIKTIEQKVDVMLSKISSSHDLYLNLLLIKSFCVIRVAHNLHKNNYYSKSFFEMKPVIVEYRNMLQPFKNRAEGIWLYMIIQALYGATIEDENSESSVNSTICESEALEALQSLENAKQSYKDFVKYKTVKPWGIDDIFCCHDAEGNQLKSLSNIGLYEMFDSYIDLILIGLSLRVNDYSRIRKYGIPALKIKLMLDFNWDHKQLHDFVRKVSIIFSTGLQNDYYQQAQHLAAVAMCKIVEFRRALPPAERTTVNPIQYEASFLYVQLATYLITKSGQNIFGQKDPKNTTNHECIRLMPESDFLSQYETCYPSDLVQNVKDYEKVKKKALLWIKRMNELKETNTASPDLSDPILPKVDQYVADLLDNFYS